MPGPGCQAEAVLSESQPGSLINFLSFSAFWLDWYLSPSSFSPDYYHQDYNKSTISLESSLSMISQIEKIIYHFREKKKKKKCQKEKDIVEPSQV